MTSSDGEVRKAAEAPEPFGGYERERVLFDAWWAAQDYAPATPDIQRRKAWDAWYSRAPASPPAPGETGGAS